MEWLAFIAGVLCGYLVRGEPRIEDIKELAVKPLAKLKKVEKRAPKVNDDRKAWLKEVGRIG